MQKTKNIDIINIGLVIVSLIIAIKIPFQLFLFSFAFFGPLHYLTEIFWLKERNYYIKSNVSWVKLYFFVATVLSIYPVLSFLDFEFLPKLQVFFINISQLSYVFTFTCFLFAVGLVTITKNKKLIIILLSVLLLSFIIEMYFLQFFILFTYLLSTLIHVYLFTLIFVVYGALKAKSTYGYYLALLLFMVPFILFLIPLNYTYNAPSKEIITIFSKTNLSSLSDTIAIVINKMTNGTLYTYSEIIIRAQIFISFAYTYHYLNWFSKTSIIGWNKSITQKKGLLIIIIWILSSSIYVYDYKAGFIFLAFLSFLHVLLEFPLNIVTIREIYLKMIKQSNK